MATSTTTTASETVKKLGQFLEERQEPFILEAYLSERGCVRKLNSGKSSSSTKRFSFYTKLLKAAYNKLGSIKDVFRIKNSNDFPRVAETDQFSSTSSSTSDSNSSSDNQVQSRNEEATSVLQQESEQISPVSVLQEENQSKSYTTQQAKKFTEDPLHSASLWNFEELTSWSSKPNSQLFKSKKILQQTKQLLFDCVREVLKNTTRQQQQQQQHSCKELMGPELLGKLMSEKLKAWEKQSGDELNITRLLDFDFQDSVQEWSDFAPQVRGIAFQIGDAILEDIRDQIVSEMVPL